MNKDMRLLVTFPRHPKTIKLKRILGTWEPIIVLWLWAAENRPNGDLSGLQDEDIAIAAGWNEHADTLIDALLKVKFIEVSKDGAYALHGWEEHNAWAANAEMRSNKAKLAAKSRWDRRNGICSNDAKGCSEHARSNAPSPIPSPSPSPSPSLKKQTYSSNEHLPIYPDGFGKNGDGRGVLFDRFWNAYPKKVGKAAAKSVFDRIMKNSKTPPACLMDIMVLAIDKQKKSEQWKKDGGQFIPHPRTWLNQGRWEDVPDCEIEKGVRIDYAKFK